MRISKTEGLIISVVGIITLPVWGPIYLARKLYKKARGRL